MNLKKIILLFLILCSFIHIVFSQEFMLSFDVTNSSFEGGELEITEIPYSSTKQTVFEIKISQREFTKISDLGIADKILLKLDYFDFNKNEYEKEDHEIVISKVTDEDIYLFIYSNPIAIFIDKGEIKSIDINDDNIKDLKIKYLGLNEKQLGILQVMNDDTGDYKKTGDRFCLISELKCVEIKNKLTGEFNEIKILSETDVDQFLQNKKQVSNESITNFEIKQTSVKDEDSKIRIISLIILIIIFVGFGFYHFFYKKTDNLKNTTDEDIFGD